MAIPSRQIGWGTEENLLWEISKQMESLICTAGCGMSGGGTGTSGTSGASGLSGTSGTSGIVGTSGTSGTNGISGTSGTSASSGTAGLTGTSGTSGVSPTIPVSVNYGLYAQIADSTPVTNTVVETTIIGPGVGTLTVPANAFTVGDSFLCSLDGLITCTSASTVEIRIRTLGGALLADTGIIDLAAATDKTWLINLYFTIRAIGAAGTASLSSGGLFSYIRNGGTQFEGYVLSEINSTTFDTTINNTLVITAQWDTATINNSIVTRNFTLTKVY